MRRLLLFISIIPILIALVLRKIKADATLRSCSQIALTTTAEEKGEKMLASLNHAPIPLPPIKGSQTTASAHGQTALRVGIALLSERDPKSIARRRWAQRFGQVFPIFTSIVCIFGFAVAKLPALWALSIIIASLGLATCAQILTLSAEIQAAEIACVLIEKKRIYPRLTEEEAVVKATQAWPWRSLIPGILSRLM